MMQDLKNWVDPMDMLKDKLRVGQKDILMPKLGYSMYSRIK